jgi:hypothetical protein
MRRTQTHGNAARLLLFSVLATACLIGTTLIATPARADVIFSDFGPGDTYLSDGYYVFFASGPGGGRSEAAGHFETGSSVFDDIVFEGAFLAGPFQSLGEGSVSFSLHSDNGGVPGDSIANSGYFAIDPKGSILTWTLDPSVTLNPNTDYWFSAQGDFVGADWAKNNQGATGAAFQSASFGGGHPPSGGSFSPWAFHTDTAAPAFRVSGSVVSPAVVPEPGTVAFSTMLSCSLLGLMVRAKRRTHS